MLGEFCDKNKMDELMLLHILNQYEKLDSAIDKIREKFGDKSVFRATCLEKRSLPEQTGQEEDSRG